MQRSEVRYCTQDSPLPGTRRVFRAERQSDGKRVVIKRARELYPNPAEVASLRHEFSVLSRLDGSQAARPLELIESDGNIGLVLEHASGQSLDAIIAAGPPELLRFTRLALCVAKALATVHRLGVVHRDIKPHHFFVDEARGDAILIDFGLATDLPRERQLPIELDRLEGTLAYISPEQTGRTNRSVDRRSDLYSLGVTLYELCTGQLPFAAEGALEVVHAHIARRPPSPRARRPDLPEGLEDIVLRLLAKIPDERYQTAAGLVSDLERAHEELSRSGSVARFSLGENDHDGQLRISEKLYGRQAQARALLESVGRVRDGARQLTLITGPAGVGKSALVQEIHRELVRGGHFVSGKFDQYHRGVPYSALGKACGELVRVFLASAPSELDAWKKRLGAALGSNARVVLEVVPELELVLGEQPAVPSLPPNEAQKRFERSFRKFMQASACSGSPLVLFLDDLQWADSASLAVLELVLSSPEQSHLLAIGNYRDDEVDAAHPLLRCLERIEGHLPVERIALTPLSAADVEQLVADALPLRQMPPEPLARLLTDKTSGNPFFVAQFLERLSAEGLLPFEPGRGYFWDLDAIASLEATDNVVALVVRRLGALSPATQELLRLAACVGQTFRLRALCAVAGRSAQEVASALAPAVTGGFLLPQDQRHRMLDDLLAGGDDVAVDAHYRFAHDRVQQAAYATIPESDRARVHLRIGRLLLSSCGEGGPSDEQLFDVVAQLNLGRAHLDSAAERERLASLNLRAAKRAKSAAAHASVLEFSAACLELLGSAPFAADPEASLSAHLLTAEAHYLSGGEEQALQAIAVIEKHARTVLERVAALNLKTAILTNQGRLQAASAVSLAAMELLGERLPDPHDPAALGQAIGEAFGAYQQALGGREVASLRELPPMTDPERLALVATMAAEIPAAFQWNTNLMVLIVLRAVRLPLEHGTAPSSPFLYALYGTVHNVVTRDYARSHQFGQLAVELARRPEHTVARGGVHFIYATFLSPWVRPLADSFVHYDQGVVDAFEVGDQIHALYCLSVAPLSRLYAGEPLAAVASPISERLQTVRAHGDVINRMFLWILEGTIACLDGTAPSAHSLESESFSEEQLQGQSAALPPSVAGVYGAHKMMVCYFGGDFEGVLEAAERFAPLPGFVYNADRVFYQGMACAELAAEAAPERRQQLLQQLDAAVEDFGIWARSCPHNFAARHALLRAEALCCQAQTDQALDAFETAIERASETSALHHLALAFERCGLFHERQGRKRLALEALGRACYQYERWGALAKVTQLCARFPGILRSFATDSIPGSRDLANTASASRSGSAGSDRLDLISAMRATEAIASELRLEPLLRRLLQILVENAGATRAALVLPQGEGLRLRATFRVEPAEVAVDLDEPIEASRSLASTLVQYCARTHEAVVLDDAARDGRFAHDPFVIAHASKSMICLPLCHHGKLAGVLCLENDTTTGAFHSGRVERLEFLGGHAAASLVNAQLYDQLALANESLERRVRERTAELSGRNQDMRRVLDNVTQGLLTIDVRGRLASERSRVVDQWFGPFEPGTEFRVYAARIDEGFAETFAATFDMLLDGFLPDDVALGQMPTQLGHGSRRYRASYEAIRSGDQLSGLLIVLDDVTESLRRARDEAEQSEELALCRGLARDREGLLGFFDEARAIVEQLSRASVTVEELRPELHTLKGSAGMLGLTVLAERCHAAEDAIEAGALVAEHVQGVVERFDSLRRTLALIAGDKASDRVEVSRDALDSLAARVEGGLAPGEVSEELERLQLEPLSRPLARLGEHARVLAQRLGKGRVEVEVQDGGSLGNARTAAPLWAALVHLVRNAVDHGLEFPAERAAAGKPSAARVSFNASQSQQGTRIEVSDDGRGVDWERVRTLAERRGLPAKSRQDLTRALFAPALSTRDEVSDTSGRGVGLDAVRAEVERLGGRVELESEPGAGSRFVVHVPTAALRARPLAGESYGG